jgi:hypothetical protein
MGPDGTDRARGRRPLRPPSDRGRDRSKLAQPFAGRLAEEIERTLATKEHPELAGNAVVTRKVQQLRVEMHEEFRRVSGEFAQRLDTLQNRVAQRLDHQRCGLMSSIPVLFLPIMGNIRQDLLR